MKLNWATLNSRPTQEINDFLCYENENLIGYLALYAFNKKEAEVTAMTHPNHRRQGVFRQLLTVAQTELNRRNVADFLFICEQASNSGAACMQAIRARYDFSEYKMDFKRKGALTVPSPPKLHLRPAQPDDLADMIRMDELCFEISGSATQDHLQKVLTDPHRKAWIATINSHTIGKIQVTLTPTETYISGFCLFPQYRRQGYGTAILTQTVSQLLSNGYNNITLEVATENRAALSLYERCAFVVTTAYDYYRLPVNASE